MHRPFKGEWLRKRGIEGGGRRRGGRVKGRATKLEDYSGPFQSINILMIWYSECNVGESAIDTVNK